MVVAKNALFPMEVTDAGMTMEVSAVDRNALGPMEVTDAGISMELSADDWNAAPPMSVSTLFGAKVMVRRLVVP